MSKQVRFRRGTTAQHAVFTGPAGEVTVDTDKKVTVVHDGVTAGGIPTARADRPRGWTKTEVITATSTWTQTGKPDLKRIMVWAWGGGGNGSTNAGGSGGHGWVKLEASAVTTNVTVTIGGAGGGTTSFGSYITCTGGANGGAEATAAAPGSASGTGVINLGATCGSWRAGGATVSFGRGLGGGNGGIAAKGITGSGGGQSAAGAQGGIIIQEIYGFV
jgi:hypothetical protein